jgi:hypothetical protein
MILGKNLMILDKYLLDIHKVSWGKKGQHILQNAMPIKIDNYVFVKPTN